jgi:hypothetical protein
MQDVDLAELARHLKRVFTTDAPRGYVVGRTLVRDAVVLKLECSQLEAEELVDTMVARGFLHYPGAPDQVDQLARWTISSAPDSD